MNFDKRILQFFWGALGMALAFLIDYIGSNLGVFNLPSDVVVFLGVLIPVITKGIRNWSNELENPLP
jgi:hypothetical protein